MLSGVQNRALKLVVSGQKPSDSERENLRKSCAQSLASRYKTRCEIYLQFFGPEKLPFAMHYVIEKQGPKMALYHEKLWNKLDAVASLMPFDEA